MEFTLEQIKIAKRLSYGANLFQSHFFRDSLFREQFEDSYKALICFVENYAYQRQGAPIKAYAEIAKMAIEQVFEGDISSVSKNDAQQVWKKYQEIAVREFNDLKVNERNNPLNSNGGVVSLLADGQIRNNNLALLVRHLLEDKKTKEAHKLIVSIRGIGTKIGPLYLRDIAHLGSIPESKIEDQYLLQPIDTWLNQALSILFGSDVPRKLKEKQEKIVKLCEQANVSPTAFNEGAWVLGSEIAVDYKTFQQIAGGQNVKSIIKEHIEEKKNYVSELELLLQNWPES